MPKRLGRCRSGHVADGIYRRAQLAGGKRVWVRIEGLAYCPECQVVLKATSRDYPDSARTPMVPDPRYA